MHQVLMQTVSGWIEVLVTDGVIIVAAHSWILFVNMKILSKVIAMFHTFPSKQSVRAAKQHITEKHPINCFT